MTGEVVYLYAFDVAHEIDTSHVASFLGHKPVPYDVPVDRAVPRDASFYRPLTVEPTAATTVGERPVRLRVRVYSVGVVTVTACVPVVVEALAELQPFHQPRLDDGRKLDQLAQNLCGDVYRALRHLMTQPSEPGTPEAYTVFCLTDVGPEADVNRWLQDQRRAVAGLLTETDAARLSEAQVNEVLRLTRSYETSDLVVLDWDAALVVDQTGAVEDVLYVLEVANLQLEEFKVIDRTLDRYLDRAYADLEREPFPLFGGSAGVLRSLRRIRVDLTKLTDEVMHIIKFVGDWYLARVYVGARERFYLDQWRASVEQRLGQLDQLYSVFHADVNERRMLWLEILIAVLIVIEVVGPFFFRGH
jgi:hypothetical protein